MSSDFNQPLDSQYRCPSGALGRKVGRDMARQHAQETHWTVALLQPQPGDHILELGFGPGMAIQELAGQVTTGLIAGVDYSETMVRAARWRNAQAIRAGRVDLRHSDAAHLPFADASFDKAFGIHTIYFWPQPVVALREAWRVLKPGGMLIITVLPKDRWPANPPGAACAVGTPDCTPYSGEEIVRMMVEAGFRSTRVVADPERQHASSFSVVGEK